MFKRIINIVVLISIVFILYFDINAINNTLESNPFPKAKIEDNFYDDEVIVVLKKGYGGLNKSINIKDFETPIIINKENIGNYDDLDNLIIIESITDLTYLDNPDKVKNKEDYLQILSIKLMNKSKEDVLRAIDEFEKLEFILSAEPRYIYDIKYFTNDSYYNNQWGVKDTNGIKVTDAWNLIGYGKTYPFIRVGIFEASIDELHPDLRVVSGSFSPSSSVSKIHGTHVGGIIGAITNNNLGIAGLAQVEIATLNASTFVSSINWAINNEIKIINASFGYLNGDEYAPPSNCHISAINNFAINDGMLICAAGNDDENNDSNPVYPAGYANSDLYPNITNVISVGAHDSICNRANFSNYGSLSVDLFAPGKHILSTIPISYCQTHNIVFNDGTRLCEFSEENITVLCNLVNSGTYTWSQIINNFESYFNFSPADLKESEHFQNGYHYMDGTSMAAPFVSGTAALLLSIDNSLTATQIKNAILNSVDIPNVNNVNPLFGLCVTNGKLNTYNAIKYVLKNYSNIENNLPLYFTTFTLSKNIIGGDTYFNDKNAFYKLNVTSSQTLDINITSSYPFIVKLYDNDFNEIVYNFTNITNGINLSKNCNSGTYYLRIYFQNENQSGTIYTEVVNNHIHNYTRWQYYNHGEHIEKCLCGQTGSIKRSHIVSNLATGRYRRCLECGRLLDMNVDYAIVSHGLRMPNFSKTNIGEQKEPPYRYKIGPYPETPRLPLIYPEGKIKNYLWGCSPKLDIQ